MPPLSKKAFAKPTKKICNTFKQPLLTQKNIEDVMHTVGKSKKHSSKVSFGMKLKKTVSMHLSFEEAQPGDNSENASLGMNTPDGTDNYLKFVQSFSQSDKENSICSTPLTQDSILSKSLDDLFKSVDRIDSGLLASESVDISQQVKESLDSDVSLSQEYLNRKEVKNAYLECVDNLGLDKFDIMKEPKKKMSKCIKSKPLDDPFKSVVRIESGLLAESTEISQDVKASLDSGVSLSQEYLNQQEVKNAYLQCVNNFGLEKFNVVQKPTKKKPKCKSSNDVSNKKCELKKQSKVPKHSESRDKSNIERKDREGNKKRKLSKDVSVVEAKHVEGKIQRKSKKENPKKEPAKKSLENQHNKVENMSLYDKMILIQESRDVGLYALCDICDKARYLPDVKDPLDLPAKWYCSMNPDREHNKCSSPEEIDENEVEFLIDNLYNAGSIVWAKMDGYPWWPAMVEDDPDEEEYCWLEKDIPQPTWYHVTFFDSYDVSRAWLRPSCLKPFKINMTNPMFQTPKFNKFKPRIDASFKQAVDAIGLPLIDRLRKYSFIQRYSKSWKLKNVTAKKQNQSKVKPKKQNNGLELKKPKHCRRILSSSTNEDISDILNTMDWQNDGSFNINLLE